MPAGLTMSNPTSTRQFFLDLIEGHKPEFFFEGQTDFSTWHANFFARFRECLGALPEAIPLTSETQWEGTEDGIHKKKILLHTAAHTFVPAIILRPESEILGAIVAIHGHGPCGKDPVAGATYLEAASQQAHYNYGYGLELARAGHLVICPDLRPFGERSDSMPGERPLPGRDPCNVHAIKGWLLGWNLLTYNLWDLRCCIDHLIACENADPARIGVIGLSGGGAAAMHLGAWDPRISATAIICALNSYRSWAIETDNFCGTQFLPGMFRHGDHAEICGLIAPRFLHIEHGGFDYGFPVADTRCALERLSCIYAAAGVPDHLTSHLGYGGHQYYGTAPAFFARAFNG